MTHVIEPATSGRARCRGCGQPIGKGELRFGERQPSAFGDGEMTLWFHLRCGAFKRPEPFLEALAAARHGGERVLEPSDAAWLLATAEQGVAHRRLPRVNGAERAPTGRARCRSCRDVIDKDAWRIPLAFFEEYRFQPSGFVHAGCALEYFGTFDLLDRARHFDPSLSAEDIESLRSALLGAR